MDERDSVGLWRVVLCFGGDGGGGMSFEACVLSGTGLYMAVFGMPADEDEIEVMSAGRPGRPGGMVIGGGGGGG